MGKKISKKRIVGIVCLVLFVAITVLGFIFYGTLHDPEGWFFSNPTGIGFFDAVITKVPTLVECAQILAITLIVLYIACGIINAVFRGTPRRVTIGKLTKSILTVVIWVFAVIAILAAWGFNVGALIASAGVLTLIIGLGMQSLIADVVAGIFLVCDGTLQVGDIVVIDGWRGEVQEIGIRNTKLIDYRGYIRVANNSTIKIYVNQSRELSVAECVISVDYGTDLQQLETVIRSNLGTLTERVEAATGPLAGKVDYKGVTALNASGVDLLFFAPCKEADLYTVQRALYKELKVLFDENGIVIPFPQVTLSQRPAEEQETHEAHSGTAQETSEQQ